MFMHDQVAGEAKRADYLPAVEHPKSGHSEDYRESISAVVCNIVISLSHDDEYPPFLGGIQFSLTNADN
jgi:hypothetical protein